ncbi:hypothetical protein [Williamsia muralis]|uniref:hypothetical protein n=1 Tax=Williamsia marianensis TaxID=85044 RepID=UPI000AC01423|nr:hypothetical protein [Williamsia marianensis]PVY27170.1 hypothetical protein C7458_11257 [Williamsia marianensis]
MNTQIVVAAIIAFAVVFAIQLFRISPRDAWGKRHITGRAVFFSGLSAALLSVSILFFMITVFIGVLMLFVLVFGLFARAA